MWNYSFTLPSAMILLILVTYYFRRPRLPLRMNRTFLMLLLIDALTIVTDYASSRVDETYMNHSAALGYAANLAFFVFFLARIFCFFLYILDILENHIRLPARFRGWSSVVFALSELVALSSPVTHAVFFMDESGYHRGPCYDVLYVCFFFYLALALFLILKNARKLPNPVRDGLLSVVAILTLGNIARILLPTLLVMNTFCLMAILAIYLSFQNPDLFLSDRGNAFNTRGFRFLLREWNQKDSYRLLAFAIRDYSEIRGVYGGLQMDRCIGQIIEFLTENYPECLVFYLRNGAFVLIGPKNMDCQTMSEDISGRFRDAWEVMDTEMLMKPVFVEVGLEKKSADSERVISMLLLALDSAGRSEPGDDLAAPLSINAIDRYLVEKRALELALEQDRLEVYFQPLVDSKDGSLVGAEALARLRAEDGSLIPPMEFIPIAEKDGSIIALGEQVIRKTCQFIRDNDMEALGLQWINVNLSPHQCMSRDLADRFGAILREYGVPAELIHLELTEQSILDYAMLKNQLIGLQELGFQFALDDYGSGYSNLTRVKQYPFKNIKIDMEVVQNYFRDRDPILPTLVQAFRQMNFSITAEGIETKEMADAMAEIGCDYLQGYYFSKPIPMSAFLMRYSVKA